jgi:hypothetical protein
VAVIAVKCNPNCNHRRSIPGLLHDAGYRPGADRPSSLHWGQEQDVHSAVVHDEPRAPGDVRQLALARYGGVGFALTISTTAAAIDRSM